MTAAVGMTLGIVQVEDAGHYPDADREGKADRDEPDPDTTGSPVNSRVDRAEGDGKYTTDQVSNSLLWPLCYFAF